MEPQTQTLDPKIADRIGELLADSLIDEDIKEDILENLPALPEHLIVRLLDSLEKEHDQLDQVALEIATFIKDQDKDWQSLESKQKSQAEQFIEKAFKNLENEADIEDIKGSID